LGHPLKLEYLKEKGHFQNFWTKLKKLIGLGHPLRLEYLKEKGLLTFLNETQKLYASWPPVRT
jgi:hypothetical protein